MIIRSPQFLVRNASPVGYDVVVSHPIRRTGQHWGKFSWRHDGTLIENPRGSLPGRERPVVAAGQILVLGIGILYDSYMTEMAVSKAREHLADVIASAQRTGEPVYLTRRGHAVAVVLDPVVFEKLLDDAEDALDRAELALARDDDDFIPWEQVKADLGLT